MSESEQRIVPWPGGRPPGPWGQRPPTGVWPPCPPGPPGPGPFPMPPDVFSAFAWMAKNWAEVKAAKEFLKTLIEDIFADDPEFLARTSAIKGVTDGSAAQPGMVGEVVLLGKNPIPIPVSAGWNLQPVMCGVLPPGDWDCWGWGGFDIPLGSAEVYLDPQPAGFINNVFAYYQSTVSEVGIAMQMLHSPARTSVPSLINFTLGTVNTGSAGTGYLGFVARRVR